MPTRRYILHSCKNHGLLNEFLSGFNNYSVSVTGILKADAFPRSSLLWGKTSVWFDKYASWFSWLAVKLSKPEAIARAGWVGGGCCAEPAGLGPRRNHQLSPGGKWSLGRPGLSPCGSAESRVHIAVGNCVLSKHTGCCGTFFSKIPVLHEAPAGISSVGMGGFSPQRAGVQCPTEALCSGRRCAVKECAKQYDKNDVLIRWES